MKVLIVEDSELLQTRLNKVLLEVNKKVRIMQAFNCKEALELFPSVRPEVVILDIALPDGSGIDLLRKFKEDNPMVKVIIFTNYSTSEFKKSCMDLGASQFIDKSNLLSLINTFI